MDCSQSNPSEVTLEELAEPFSRHLCEHIAHSPKQVTSRSSHFLDTCRAYNDGTVTRDELLQTTVQNGFNNVIDAFHIVGGSALPVRFYAKDYRASARKIILTDEIFKLQDAAFPESLSMEAEARWRLVETAWEQQISTGLLAIEYNAIGDLLFTSSKNRRKAVTSVCARTSATARSTTSTTAKSSPNSPPRPRTSPRKATSSGTMRRCIWGRGVWFWGRGL